MSKVIETHVLKEYQVLRQLGSGSYGYVWEVFDRESRKKLALKKVFDAFRNVVDSQRTYRETEVLSKLDCGQIVKLERVINSKGNKDVYLLFECMESDLFEVNKMNILSNEHTKYVLFQILMGLEYLHDSELMHRDLKPSNILINSDSSIKICDFGLVRKIRHCSERDGKEAVMTEEVATKWYRAPELLLGSTHYSEKVDVWSFGCIAAELLLKKPLFCGATTQSQLEMILSIDENVTAEDFDALNVQKVEYLTQINDLIHEKGLKTQLGNQHQEYFQLLRGCLHVNPKKRRGVQQLLKLSVFDSIRKLCPLTGRGIAMKFQFSLNDETKFSISEYQKQIDLISARTDRNNNYHHHENKGHYLERINRLERRAKFEVGQNQSSGRPKRVEEIKSLHRSKYSQIGLTGGFKKLENFESHTRSYHVSLEKVGARNLQNQQPIRNEQSDFYGPNNCLGKKDKQSSVYLKKQAIVRRPFQIRQQSLDVQYPLRVGKSSFRNKFSRRGKQNSLITQEDEINGREAEQNRKLLEAYKMSITSVIYQSKKGKKSCPKWKY